MIYVTFYHLCVRDVTRLIKIMPYDTFDVIDKNQSGKNTFSYSLNDLDDDFAGSDVEL
jgi:hypothetical protein